MRKPAEADYPAAGRGSYVEFFGPKERLERELRDSLLGVNMLESGEDVQIVVPVTTRGRRWQSRLQSLVSLFGEELWRLDSSVPSSVLALTDRRVLVARPRPAPGAPERMEDPFSAPRSRVSVVRFRHVVLRSSLTLRTDERTLTVAAPRRFRPELERIVGALAGPISS